MTRDENTGIIGLLNRARAAKVQHVEKLGSAFLATWAGTSSATGLPAALGYVATRGGE